jgi:hypothetical protein
MTRAPLKLTQSREAAMDGTGTPQPPGYEIEAEIFSAGFWNGETFTEDDLAELAANFARLKDELKPPLKVGHDGNQILAGQSDGDPALGWVSALRVTGGKLVATFTGVPRVLVEAIRQGRYRRVSAELYFNLRHRGQRIGKALKAVALLGADLPAVTNLNDLSAYLAARPNWEAGEIKAFTGPFRADLHSPGKERIMPEDHAAAALEAELAELRAYKARQEQDQEQERRRRVADGFGSARQAALAFCEEQVRRGRLAPALREALLRDFDAQAHAFGADGRLGVPWDTVRALLEQGPPAPLGQEAAFAADEPESEPPGDPSARLAALANRKMVELNLTYSQAAQYVMKTRPDLARAYRDYTLNPSLGG